MGTSQVPEELAVKERPRVTDRKWDGNSPKINSSYKTRVSNGLEGSLSPTPYHTEGSQPREGKCLAHGHTASP